jgi:hypothetical protein
MDHPTQPEPEPAPPPDPPTEPATTWTPAPEAPAEPAATWVPGSEALTEPALTSAWVPEPPVRYRDPLAVAIANASLFSVGYLLLGKKLLAVAAWLVTITLVIILAAEARSVWFEIIVLGWWVAVVAHGWFLARRRGRRGQQVRRSGPGKQRLGALAFTLPVLLAVGLLRWDAARIAQDVADAKHDGDCDRAMSALDQRWAGHWVTDAPLTASGDVTVEACQQVRRASGELRDVLSGDTAALEPAINRLTTVLADLPGHEMMVARILDAFLRYLPSADPCDITIVTNSLGRMRENGTVLDRVVDAVPRVAPAALVECGDNLMAAQQWQPARDRYQQLLDQYPDHKLAPQAKDGVQKATLAIELANVTTLLTGTPPQYCTNPAAYSGAAPFGAGKANPALFYSADDYTNRLPAEWKAPDAANAVLVVCAGTPEFGAPVETCGYDYGIGYTQYKVITFHKVKIPLRAFELKTGRVVIDGWVEVGGASCPPTVQYTEIGYADFGPPSDMYVTPSDADVQAGFAPVITP